MNAKPPKSQRVSPSAFMRQLRPEYYSDTSDRTAYQLDCATLEFHLETITSRNQTNDFQVFCRKLCERAICPNLRPATGPEGGGDSKADTETTPVADEVSLLYYSAAANAGRERWAFAFSAKKNWTAKVRSDVAGIVGTGRNYERIICVTARFARDKARSRLEDELHHKYGIPVTIHDKTWIVKEVVENDRRDLAFNYLKVGTEVIGKRLGPEDYSRTQQLEDIEKGIEDPTRFEGMETQRVAEALVAAKLSRNLERPRIETEGRFTRAIRLADADGTHRQRLEAHYEHLWTGFWWFDDVAMLNEGYDAFEALSQKTDHAVDLEFQCNLTQLLFNAVIHQHLSGDEAKLDERVGRLARRLAHVAGDAARPNNSLLARMELLQIEVNRAVLSQEPAQLVPIWPRISKVLEAAKGLGEFPAEKLTRLIEVFGGVAGSDPGYTRLVEQTAEFVAARKSEAEGALVLLTRAKQLDFDQRMEMIRLLGKAGHQLSKKEYASSMIDATRLLSLAYRSAGLLWAARASCFLALASIFIEAEEESEVPASVIPTLMILAWIGLELRHLPDTFEAIRLARGCVVGLPLTDDSKQHAERRLEEFDLTFASYLLNSTEEDVVRCTQLPDVLHGLGLHHSATALLFMLGHEALLREHGLDESSDELSDFYGRLAGKTGPPDKLASMILNAPDTLGVYLSKVLGMRVEVAHSGTEASCLAAEAVIGAIEASFATTLDFEILPHTEKFVIDIRECSGPSVPEYSITPEDGRAEVRWPMGLLSGDFGAYAGVYDLLVQLSASVLVATCAVPNAQSLLARLVSDDGVLYRISMVIAASSSRSRILKSPLGRLSDWASLAERSYPALEPRPRIVRAPVRNAHGESAHELAEATHIDESDRPAVQSHRDVTLHSIIDAHLWNRAKWRGAAFVRWGDIPGIALLFRDGTAGKEIFTRWRYRFGEVDKDDEICVAIIRGVSVSHPAHYRMLITSKPHARQDVEPGQQLMFAGRIQTLEPSTDANLVRFLNEYSSVGRYLLMPAQIAPGNDGPQLLWDCAIRKQRLSVKWVSEVAPGDVEMMAVAARNPG